MKKLALVLALLLVPSLAWAQCTGVFPPNTLCGNLSGSPAPPSAFSASGTVVGPGSTTVGDIAVWNNTGGTLLKDVPPLQIYGTIGNNLFLAGPSTGGPLNPTFRAITSADFGSVSNPTTQSLTSGTGATYTTPANARWLEVFMVGGGGGGAGASASALVSGTTGGTSTFNSINAIGGGGAPAAPTVAGGQPGLGGTGGTGTANRRQPGSPGQPGNFNTQGDFYGGGGGASYFGGGAPTLTVIATTVGNSAPANTGSGGSGAVHVTNPADGGGGGAGEFVYLIIGAPAATYSYTIGTAGAGGVSTVNGGAGGTGFIFVIEHYAP